MKGKKHEKTYLLFLVLAIAFGMMLCSCKTQKEPTQDEPESESVNQPTEPASEENTAPTEAPTEPEPPKLAINYDLLDGIGLSCTELEEKHGAITSYNSPHGGQGYIYENGYGIYCFVPEPFTKRYYDDPDTCPKIYNNWWYDENGYCVPITDEENKCGGIDRIKLSDVLLNEGDTVSINDIKEIDWVEIETEADEYLPGDWYPLYSVFSVMGYDNLIIEIKHRDPESLETDDLDDANVSIIYQNR